MRLWRIILGMLLISIGHATSIPNTPKARGAVWFMNYCAGCHRLQSTSWKRVMTDLSIQPQGEMDISPVHLAVIDLDGYNGLSTEDAQQWFATIPPDLSTISRLRGSRWLKAYLLGFYPESSGRYGVANRMITNVAMPNVLFSVQRQMTSQAFTEVIADIVSFLAYVSDPTQELRYQIGFWVVSFLGICCSVVGLFWRRKVKYNGEKL